MIFTFYGGSFLGCHSVFLFLVIILELGIISCMPSTYYEMLNVTINSSEEEIKKSYRKLALIYHPDKYKPTNRSTECEDDSGYCNGVDLFLQIQTAYEILSDSERRKQYDLSLDGVQYDILLEESEGLDEDNSIRYQSVPFNLFMKSSKMKLHFSAEFPKKKIEDLNINLPIDISHTLTGYEKKHIYFRKTVCVVCGGNGGFNGECEQCSHCQGSGIGSDVYSHPNGKFEQLTKTRCSKCKGKGCIPTRKCINCRGIGYSMIENVINIALPMGFRNGDTRTIPNAGHMHIDGRVGNIVISIAYSIPAGWQYDISSATLQFTSIVPLNDLINGYKSAIITPFNETIKFEIDKGLKLSDIVFEGIYIQGVGMGGLRSVVNPGTRDVIRGDAVIHLKPDLKSMSPENFISLLQESGLKQDDPIYRRLFAVLLKKDGDSSEESDGDKYKSRDDGIRFSDS